MRDFWNALKYIWQNVSTKSLLVFFFYSFIKGFVLQFESARENTQEIASLENDTLSDRDSALINIVFGIVSTFVLLFTFSSTASFSISNRQREESPPPLPDIEEVIGDDDLVGVPKELQRGCGRRVLDAGNRLAIISCATVKTMGAGISVLALTAAYFRSWVGLGIGASLGVAYLPIGMLSELPRLNYRDDNLGQVMKDYLGEHPSNWQYVKLGLCTLTAFVVAYEFGRYDILLNWVKFLKMPVYINPDKYVTLGSGIELGDTVFRWSTLGLTLLLAFWNGYPAFHKLLPPMLNVSKSSPKKCLNNITSSFFQAVQNPKDVLVFLASSLKTFNVIVSAWFVATELFGFSSWPAAILQGLFGYFLAQLVFNAHTPKKQEARIIDVEAASSSSDATSDEENLGLLNFDEGCVPDSYNAMAVQHQH